MAELRMLLCTDMDRTVIPNGEQPEPSGARERFASFCAQPGVTLAYVTGRGKGLAQEAIRTYSLPEPDVAITDVGTMIYRVADGAWSEWTEWSDTIAQDWAGRSHEEIADYLAGIDALRLQEPEKQGAHKISFYAAPSAESASLVETVERLLAEQGVQANCIWSVDDSSGTGLLDILPRRANKLFAIEFVRRALMMEPSDTIFAGDSGNDLPVLISSVQSVLVGNASEAIKRQAQESAAQLGHADTLYIAEAAYAAGVLEGVAHWQRQAR